MVAVTTAATVLGCLQVYVDRISHFLFGTQFTVLESRKFLGGSLSLSAGTLMVTALNSVMPSAQRYIDDSPHKKEVNVWILVSVFTGFCCCLAMNYLVHHIITRSAVRCPHMLTHKAHPTENSQLLDSENGSLISERNRSNQLQLVVVALQTVLAIAIHRVPEGFLIYATANNDEELGSNMILALTIHSFCEGFSIVAPLCSALGSRFHAVLIASLLGGGSQPLGALIAVYLLPNSGFQASSFFLFGICMGFTSGFMIIIALQLIATAAELVDSTLAVSWSVIGIFLVLLTRCI